MTLLLHRSRAVAQVQSPALRYKTCSLQNHGQGPLTAAYAFAKAQRLAHKQGHGCIRAAGAGPGPMLTAVVVSAPGPQAPGPPKPPPRPAGEA
jgi:hypothetical protein